MRRVGARRPIEASQPVVHAVHSPVLKLQMFFNILIMPIIIIFLAMILVSQIKQKSAYVIPTRRTAQTVSETQKTTTTSLLSSHVPRTLPTTTTTTTTTPVYSKVLVSSDNDYTSAIEIIDLASSKSNCSNIESFPTKLYYQAGGLEFQERPIICGKNNYNTAMCFFYENGVWKITQPFNHETDGFSMTKSYFKDGNLHLFKTGGIAYSSKFSKAEVFTQYGWQDSILLPIKIYWHCMALVSPTLAMVIGGIQDGISGKSFIFNSNTSIWHEGPELNIKRYGHSCGSIRRNSTSQKKSVIAVGGYNLNSVEILDLDSDTWRMGPELPFSISFAAMVEDPSGGVVLIGGMFEEMTLITLYRLSHAGSNVTWELMSQKLKHVQYYPTAFLVPDKITSCF